MTDMNREPSNAEILASITRLDRRFDLQDIRLAGINADLAQLSADMAEVVSVVRTLHDALRSHVNDPHAHDPHAH